MKILSNFVLAAMFTLAWGVYPGSVAQAAQTAKDAAAILLAEPLLRESVMQEAVRWMPNNAIFINNLAGVLAARGDFAQVKALRAQALAAAANPFVQAQMMAIHANDEPVR